LVSRAALASYGKQAGDQELEKNSRRIQARANRRMAELLRSVPAKGGQAAKGKSSGSRPTTPSRRKLAKAAGISIDQQMTAMRVGNVPTASFEAQVESDDPPSATLQLRAAHCDNISAPTRRASIRP
jgi:hypothetical protein